jgi:hypothetical protein
VEFGNNDVASKVWVAARVSLVVGLSNVSDGFSCAPPCAVESELRWSVPAATMAENWWHVEDSVGASPAYLSCGARRQSQSCFRWRVWPTVGMWPGRPKVVPNMVMFHDDIGALVSVFSKFSSN